MVDQDTSFEIEFKGYPATVTEEPRINGRRIFLIRFTDGRKPLFILVAQRADYSKFWTSSPEGRQSEAEQAGPIVARYLRTKQ